MCVCACTPKSYLFVFVATTNFIGMRMCVYGCVPPCSYDLPLDLLFLFFATTKILLECIRRAIDESHDSLDALLSNITYLSVILILILGSGDCCVHLGYVSCTLSFLLFF